MKKNMNSTDRIIRVLIAVITATLYFTGVVPGTLGIVLMAIGGILALTSFINWCPIYSALGISTLRSKSQETSETV